MNRYVPLILVLLACFQESSAMIYRPDRGAIWDPSIFYHDGKYHAFMMYNKEGDHGLGAGHCLYISSADGVHWKEEKVVLKEREDKTFFKCFVGKCGDSFIMNHGVRREKIQDTLRFYESSDLLNWNYLFSSNPDPRWYKDGSGCRWDHMYILPKQVGNPDEGYWGYVVSVKKSGTPGVGMMQSRDAKVWEVLPPALIEWGNQPSIDLEFGGCERIDGKYYLIGGRPYLFSKGYSMWTLVADNPRGPFQLDPVMPRLCGTSSGDFRTSITWLAAWARGKDGELLISNYASMPSLGQWSPWLLPLRKASVDKDGHLRLAWWRGNEALKGESIPLGRNAITLDGRTGEHEYSVTYLEAKSDFKQGVVVEGRMKTSAQPKVDGTSELPAAGIVLGDIATTATVIQLGIGAVGERETHVGTLLETPDGFVFESQDVTGEGCATVTGIDDGEEHTFRLLWRLEMFELYIDELLVQTYLHRSDSGKVGFFVCNAEAVFSDLNAWRMSFPSNAHANSAPLSSSTSN